MRYLLIWPDIPDSYDGKICTLSFLFPYASELSQPSLYDFSGTEQELGSDGGLNFAFLDGIANQKTTFNNQPAVLGESGPIQVIPGNEYPIVYMPCEGNAPPDIVSQCVRQSFRPKTDGHT